MDLRKGRHCSDINYNESLCSVFADLVKKINRDYAVSGERKDLFRVMQIRKATKVFEKFPKTIESVKDISNLQGIGNGIQRRVLEFLKTGTLKELEESTEAAKIILELTEVHGIGIKTAQTLHYEHHVMGIDDLKSRATETKLHLNPTIHVALKYHDLLVKKIPHDDIAEVEDYLRDTLSDFNLEFEICGSYRRKSKTSGDIDILLKNGQLQEVIKFLKQIGFLVAHLTNSNTHKYMGICTLDGDKHYRIDFLRCKEGEYYTSLLHFTGSDVFNRIVRSIAVKKGFKLTEHGLFRQADYASGTRYIEPNSEQDILESLGIKYLEPWERSF